MALFFANIRLFIRRILINYFVRDFSFASLCLLTGIPLLLYGLGLGVTNWLTNSAYGIATPPGTIVLVALCVLIGFQLLLSFFAADIAAVPRQPLHVLLDQRTIFPLKQFTPNLT